MAKNINETHKERLSLHERIGVWLTDKVGTMGAAYLFCAIALMSLPAALASENTMIIVSWLTQSFIQLVLLPVIMVGQNIQSRHAELLAENDYESDLRAEKDIEELNRKLDILLKRSETN